MRTNKIWVYATLGLVSTLVFLPFVIILLTSLKSDAEFAVRAGGLLPKEWSFDNYSKAMSAAPWGVYFKNSLIVTIVAVGGSLIFNTLAGYTFARIEFKGRDVIFIMLLMGMMIPGQVTIIPQFILLKSIPLFGGNDWFGSGGVGWLDSYYALIVPELSGSLGIFLARQYYMSIPKALDEAAYIDGSGYFQTYWRIFIPLSGPLLATLGIIKVFYVWNDFFHPLIYTTSEGMRTVQLGLQVFHGQYTIQYNQLMAATLMISLPLIVAFLLFQRQFVQSLVSSSVKG